MLNRKQSPTDFKFSVPEIIHPDISTLTNGLKIHAFHDPSVDILHIELVFQHANTLNESQTGLNLLTSKTLLSGTDLYSSEQIANKIAQLGAFIEVSPSFDYTILNVYCISDDVVEIIELLDNILSSANFKEQEVELQKNIVNTNLKTQLKKNNIRAAKLLRRSIFANHPYAKSVTEQDLKEINEALIKEHYYKCFSNVEVILSGNIKPEAINLLSETNWHKPYQNIQLFSPAIQLTKQNQSITVDKSVQTSIRMGKITIGKSNPDYSKLVLANYILGGFFGSRLMSNIREDKGLTYGIYSSVTNLKYGSFFSLGCDVKSSDTELAVSEIKKELKYIQENEIKKEEFNLAKNHFLGSFQNSLSSIYSLSEKYKNNYLYNQHSNFYQNLIIEIEKLTPKDILLTSQKYLHYSDMSFITVGG